MNSHDLATQLKLNPRAVILTGNLRERFKNSNAGQISGFTPHYATKGCAPVPYSSEGEPTSLQNDGAAIECDLHEQNQIMAGAFSSYGKPLNMVHLIFGTSANQPNTSEYKLLREAGEILKSAIGKPVHLVAVPVLSSGQYGVATGRLYLVGLFDMEGKALFVHPNAVGNILASEFPANQKQRTTQPVTLTPPTLGNQFRQISAATAGPDWYDAISTTLATVLKLKGAKLHDACIDTRAKQLAKEQGIGMKAATVLALEQYQALKHPAGKEQAAITPTPASKPVQAQPTASRRLSQARV